MNPWFLLAALLCAGTAALHAVVGGRVVLAPLGVGLDPRRFAVVEVVWHFITWHLAVMAVGLAYVAFESAPVVADLMLAHWVGYAALFLYLSRARFGRALALPQWTLFVCLALVTAAGRWSVAPQAAVGDASALVAAVALLAIALLHGYWASGGVWPGRDREGLMRTVVGAAPGERMPSRTLTLLVAGALVAAAGVALASRDLVPAFGIPPVVFTAAAWALSAVLLLRGLGGFFEVYVRRSIAGTPYAFWNERLYSPLCLALSTCVALAAAR